LYNVARGGRLGGNSFHFEEEPHQIACFGSGEAAMAVFQSPVRMSVVVGDSSIWAAFFLGRSVGKSNNCAKMSRKYIFIKKYNVEERNNRFLWVIAK
jgi:hypothetical protein